MPETETEEVLPFQITDPGGVEFDLSDSYRIGSVRVANIGISGYRLDGKPARVKTRIRLYPGIRLYYETSLREFLDSSLLNDSLDVDLNDYEPAGTTEYVLADRVKHAVGFDTEHKAFYYQFKNTYTTHSLFLEDPASTLQELYRTVDNIRDIVNLTERLERDQRDA